MNRSASLYKRHRFPPEVIQYAVWLYHRFNLSHRDIEELLAQIAGDGQRADPKPRE
jgi:transposase-like protein